MRTGHPVRAHRLPPASGIRLPVWPSSIRATSPRIDPHRAQPRRAESITTDYRLTPSAFPCSRGQEPMGDCPGDGRPDVPDAATAMGQHGDRRRVLARLEDPGLTRRTERSGDQVGPFSSPERRRLVPSPLGLRHPARWVGSETRSASSSLSQASMTRGRRSLEHRWV